MKFKALSAAIAAATLLGFSQGSMALPASATIAVNVNISGSSAQDVILQNFISGLCTSGSYTLFSYNGSTSNYWAASCTLASALTVPGAPSTIAAGTNVMYHKTSANGSIVGVLPLIEGATAPFLVVNAATCNTSNSCSTLTNIIPDAGVSDVDPAMFTGINASPFYTPGSVSSTAKLTIVDGAALVMGIAVSTNLYEALQSAQGIVGNAAGCTIGEYDKEACMPNLQSAQLASIASGQIQTWDQITYNGKALTSYAGANSVPAITDNMVHICQRESGSGTNAVVYSKILNAPCDANAFVAATDQSGNGGPNVEVMSTTGNEENCISDFANGTNAGTDINGNGDNPNKVKGWAIGWASTDRNNAAAINYRFIKVDGFAPTLANAFNGNYKLVGESTFQWLTKKGVSGDALTLVAHLAANEGNPTNVGIYDALKTQPFGQGAFMANSNAGFGSSVNTTTPVWSYSHAANGTGLDNCKAAVVDILNSSDASTAEGTAAIEFTAK